MIYIACDMNCNNYGNFFQIIAHEGLIKKDESCYIYDGGHYPLKDCYRCKPPHPISKTFRYSEAIDMLHIEDYIRWHNTRFGYDKYKLRQAVEYATHELGMSWDGNRQRLSFYEKMDEYLLAQTPHQGGER